MGTFTSSAFEPAWWLANRHLQTLWPTLFRRIPSPPCHHQVIDTPDGDILELDWCGRQGPLVIILHGLTGSSRSHYVRGLQWALLKRDWRSVVLNFRGCGRRPNRTWRCYHSGETGDLDFLYRWLREKLPSMPMAAVGYSLGGNVLLKWLGERGRDCNLFAACAVSVPLELAKCADAMDQGLSRIYRHRLLTELKEYLSHKIHFLEQLGKTEDAERLKALGDLRNIHSFWDYDDQVIAGLYPFRDVHEYYRTCSSRLYLAQIGIPTLLIQSRDDPFMTPDVIPLPAETASSVLLEISEGGGHVGFVENHFPLKPGYWLERRIPEFLQAEFVRSAQAR